MTSHKFNPPMAHELMVRANRLVESRGERSSPHVSQMSINLQIGEDEFGCGYAITKYPGSRLTIYRLGDPKGPVISLNLTNGEIVGNSNVGALRPILKIIKQMMVLEDLADV